MGDLSKHFSRWELECKCGCGLMSIVPELLEKLDCIRDIINRPLIVSSACRCAKHDLNIYLVMLRIARENRQITQMEYNLSVDEEKARKRTSSHIKGLAVDLKVTGQRERDEILAASFVVEITRRGIAETFIHVDIDKSKPQQVTWRY